MLGRYIATAVRVTYRDTSIVACGHCLATATSEQRVCAPQYNNLWIHRVEEFTEIQKINEPWKILDETTERIRSEAVNKWLSFLIG
jgi:hypothetical protein